MTVSNHVADHNSDAYPSCGNVTKRQVLAQEVHRRRASGQIAWLTNDSALFLSADDGFVYEITTIVDGRCFSLSEPRCHHRARSVGGVGQETSANLMDCP